MLVGQRHLQQREVRSTLLPSTLEFGGDQTIIRVNAIELAFCQRRGVALALKLPFSASAQGLVDLLCGLPSPR
ncbi:hypothetical protein [Rhizobium beringeri]|uniref:hypothetical protein n=1 Tax=Rhizobium beringeri TaxID=3019934 RepID=UPI003B5CE5B5